MACIGKADHPSVRQKIDVERRRLAAEENLAAFRSLGDLLAAIKPILCSAARSPGPVWSGLTDPAAFDADAV